MTVHNVAEAKALQKKTADRVKEHFRQNPVSSLQMMENGGWAVQLRFPLAITEDEKRFLKKLEKENGIKIVIEEKVGRIRQLSP